MTQLRELDEHVNVDAGRVGAQLPDVVDDATAVCFRLHPFPRPPDLRPDVWQADVWGQRPLPEDLVGPVYIAHGHHHAPIVADQGPGPQRGAAS